MSTRAGSKGWARAAAAVAVAGLTGAVALAPFAPTSSARASSAAKQCPIEGRIHLVPQWTLIRPLTFTTGAQTISGYAVDAADPDVMYITNGTAVMRSRDGGCVWKQSYALEDLPSVDQPFPAAAARIERIVVSPGTGRVILQVEETAGALGRPHIMVSDDAGESWQSRDRGLPPEGEPDFLRPAPSNPLIFYLGVNLGGGAVDLLYASEDGGQTWALRSDLGEAGSPRMVDLKVDPLDAADLWAWGPEGLLRSRDGGRRFARVEGHFEAEAGPASVFHARGDPASVMAVDADPEPVRFLKSDDGGANWLSVTTPPGTADSIAHGRTRDQILSSVGGKVWVFSPSTSSWISALAPVKDVVDLTSDRRGRFYGHTSDTVAIYTGRVGLEYFTNLPPRLVDVPVYVDGKNVHQRPASLAPRGRRIVLDPGESRRVSYRLRLSRTPVPLDVYFLVDTSGSMGPAIAGLRDALFKIVRRLDAARIDVQFGLGEFRSYPDTYPTRPMCEDVPSSVPRNQCESTFVYRRVLDIEPGSQVLYEEIGELDAASGGSYDSHLGALYQSATGEGQDLYPPGPGGHDVPAGLEPVFREQALKVVLMATDEVFGDEERGAPDPDEAATRGRNPVPPDIPEPEEVIAAFRARDMLQVGLSVGGAPRADLEQIAKGTGAVAPVGGVDCDADGSADVSSGDPLVCQFAIQRVEAGQSLAPAIVEMVGAVAEKATVRLEAGGARVVSEVLPRTYESVVLQANNSLDFDVGFHCPASLAGERTAVRLDAVTGGRVLESARAVVVCRGLPGDRPDPAALLVPAAGAIGVVPPPPPPPPPPVIELSGAPQSQAQAQAQGAVAAQHEEQPQMAFVQAFDATRDQMGEQHAFSAYRRRTSPAPVYAVLGAGAVVTSLACAYACSAARARVRVRRIR
ncbi:MAG: hypothetical protein ABR575_01100 [Actinomycetota bacterium]